MITTQTAEDVRNQLGAFLTKPLQITSETVQNVSSTNLTTGGLTGKYTMGPNGVIVSVDENGKLRAEYGKREDGTYGIAVYDSTGALMYDNTKIKTQYIFSTQMESSNANWLAVVGFISYCSDAQAERNLAVRLDFTKPSNFTITSATLYYRFVDFIDYYGVHRTTNVAFYLNPTKTLVSPASDLDYYRYSGGTTLASAISPNADEYKGSVVLSAAQIGAIASGMNYLIVQQNTSDGDIGGFCTVNLVLEGYLTTN